MHHDFDISIKGIAKTEGHASLELTVRQGKVVDAKLKVEENKRFFTQGVREKRAESVPAFLSRICGTCSPAHLLASTEAIEKALGISPSPQTSCLRKLLLYGTIIRDHAMHLGFFCLPDIFDVDSALELEPSLIDKLFQLKGAGNALAKAVGGRAIHPFKAVLGGFAGVISETEAEEVAEALKSVRPIALQLIEIFAKCKFSFEHPRLFVALCTPDFSFLEGEIRTSDGKCIPEPNYFEFLHRVIIPYSQATGFEFEGQEYMVGALARLNLNKEALHKSTKASCEELLKRFPSNDVYLNNLAQAIEILHCIDHSIELLAQPFKPEAPAKPARLSGKGVGVIEAPRGTLYHSMEIESGIVRFGNFVIPTAQNQIRMERDIRLLVELLLTKGYPKELIEKEIEKLIRAYDPCFSCASHFLKVVWKGVL